MHLILLDNWCNFIFAPKSISKNLVNSIYRFFILAALLFFFAGCDQFDYNTYQTDVYDAHVELKTNYNIEQLMSLPCKDTLKLVFTGDTQRFYDDLEDLVEQVNAIPDLDAMFIAGDITDFGVGREFKWINKELMKLNVPFLTVIGNHDCIANAKEIYREIFGPLDYSFTWNDVRFVMHNTNSREFAFNGTVPDLNWMQQQVNDTANFKGCIFVSHVPPDNVDFDKALEIPYSSLIKNTGKTIFSSNGHNHNHRIGELYNDGVIYINTSSPSNRFYALVTVYPYAIDKKFDCVFVPF